MPAVILDACSVINMINAEVIQKLEVIDGYTFHIGNLVLEECLDEAQKIVVRQCILDGVIEPVTNDLTVREFNSISNKYGLGKGESECIAYMKKIGAIVCTDDNKARRSIERDFGKPFYFGSLFILREMVRQNLISCDESIRSYAIMVISGAFLPQTDESYLCQ
ncbi:hypothetical protein [uncultured Roseivirga sp.]|uniref:hypothetical protein n=1 Tax=uncultured Roseivirga sp. TaxID=543088 RepID=UPI0030DBD439|tara:strand:+ start:29718 stop:30209 length:492 start_codon:yes stop_codon:yes gene_type:complete